MLPFFISIFCQQFIGEGRHSVNEKEKTQNPAGQPMDDHTLVVIIQGLNNQSPIDSRHRY
jgi:hypothetical protein